MWRAAHAAGQQLVDDMVYSPAGQGDSRADFVDCYRKNVIPVLYLLAGRPTTDTVKMYIDGLTPVFTADLSSIKADLDRMLPLLCRYFETVLLIDRAYRRQKLARNAIDFSDFEHDALALLRQPHIAASYRERFSEIYLDEYQDTSNIQEAVVREISRNNLFMVGDVKQSIYRFRQANPRLFQEKAEQFVLWTEADDENVAATTLESTAGHERTARRCAGSSDSFKSKLPKRAGDIVICQRFFLGFPDESEW